MSAPVADHTPARRNMPIQHLLDGGDAMRHPADPRSQRQRDDSPAARCRLAVEQVEMIHHLLDELRRLVLVEVEDLQVADLVGMRHGMDRSGLRLEPVGHVVIDPVADILAALGGDQIERVVGFGIGRRIPPFDRLARKRAQGREGTLRPTLARPPGKLRSHGCDSCRCRAPRARSPDGFTSCSTCG